MAFTEPWPAPMRLDLSRPLPEEGVPVRLRVAFSAVPGRLGLVLTTNSLNPVLRLYEDRLETRVIRTVRRRTTDIARVEANAWLRSRAPSVLTVTWTTGRLEFVARPSRAGDLALVVQFLAERGVPLGPNAQALLAA